ncbi:PKD2L1 isoform 2, partial [Pongo abelii]
PLQPQPKKPEDEPQETAHRTRVSSCCLYICQGIREVPYKREEEALEERRLSRGEIPMLQRS